MAMVNAAAVSAAFTVSATTVSVPQAGFCTTGPNSRTFGAVVTVVCATGEVVDITASARSRPGLPVHGGAYRFILPGSYAGGLPDFYDGYTGSGTVATWRIVQLADRDYYELLMGW